MHRPRITLPQKPEGWLLADLLKSIRLEVEQRAVSAAMAGECQGTELVVAGLLLQAEGVERGGHPIVEGRHSRIGHLERVK